MMENEMQLKIIKMIQEIHNDEYLKKIHDFVEVPYFLYQKEIESKE